MIPLLLVEDDRGIADFMSRGLAAGGYAVTWCATLAEAAATARHAVAILDLGLPDGDGLDLCAAWRRERPEMPVLILSARDAVDSRVAGLDAGAEDYLTKPFEFDELLARLRVLLRRRADTLPIAGGGLCVAGLSLDPASRELVFEGRRMVLTERESRLLELLMRQSGQLVTRREVLEEAWATDQEVSENAVDVYVGYLRRKLDNRRTRLIETVWGLGYRFSVPK